LRLLLDTHFLVWLTVGGAALTQAERAFLAEEEVTIFCSVVSLWELRLKWNRTTSSGKPKGPVSPEAVRSFAERAGWTFLPLVPRPALAPLNPPVAHKDPFDEMLLIQAQAEGLRLLTRDKTLLDHPLALGAG